MLVLDDVVTLNASKTPGRTALVHGDHHLTYGELARRCARLANVVEGLTEPGDRVAILAENVPAYVEAYFGVPAAGRALTLLNQRLHPREWAWILAHSGARVVLVQEAFVDALADALAEGRSGADAPVLVVVGGERPGLLSYETALAAASDRHVRATPDPDATAWIIYTSGTTGFPKGAMLSHRALLTAALASVVEYGAAPDERFLMAFPLCHIAGYAVTLSMLRGGTVVLDNVFEPRRWLGLIEQHRITASALAPTMVDAVVDAADAMGADLRSLGKLAYGAAPMPLPVLERAMGRLGPILYTGFGMTETAGNIMAHPQAAHVRAISGEPHLLTSCGKPVCFADARVVLDGRELPHGEVGELVLKGAQLLTGYLHDEAATRASFSDGWFRTGDMAKRDDEGHFSIVDRMKDMIVSGGENVYSREVEDTLQRHPLVREVAVVGVPHRKWGEAVAAVVVPAGPVADEPQVAEELIAHCRSQMAAYKRPQEVHFVDALPRTVSGKVLKRQLRDQLTRAAEVDRVDA